MDLGLSEEQQMIQTSARDFLDKECPKTLVREMEEDAKGYSPTLWKQTADLGWLGLVFAERYGGSAFHFIDLAVLLEEQGRALLPGPFLSTVVLCGMTIDKFGSEAQKQAHLPKIADGSELMVYAQTEAQGTWDAAGIQLKAIAHGANYTLSGKKIFVAHAASANAYLVAARTKDGGTNGITLFIVEAKSPGLSLHAVKTIGSDHMAHLTFTNVSVPVANVVGKADDGWSIVQQINLWGAAAKAIEMVGGAQKVLDMSVDYAKQRQQFGRPIGSFQAIQHHLANMAVDVDAARYIAYESAWRLSEGLPAEKEVSMAKSFVGEAYRRVCLVGHQVHGGVGFTKEHDMQLYFRRAKAAELAFGDADFHKEVVAAKIGI